MINMTYTLKKIEFKEQTVKTMFIYLCTCNILTEISVYASVRDASKAEFVT